MSIQIIPGFINRTQPPELPLPLTKIEPKTEIKTEPPESEEEIPDIKHIDIVSHILDETSIKRETVPENVLETKHSEWLEYETQGSVKTENAPVVKIEHLNLNKTEDNSDRNVTSQFEASNVLDNLESNKHLGLNYSDDLNSKKFEHREIVKIFETISREDKTKVKVIEALVNPVEPQEYTSWAEDEHVCNYCQFTCNILNNLKDHIINQHRTFQCPYCELKMKWKTSLKNHIIRKHTNTNDIQWLKCHLCEKKFKTKKNMNEHMKVHLTFEQMQDKLKLCPDCGKAFKALSSFKRHIKWVHNKDKHRVERKCQECDYTTTEKKLLRHHIKNIHRKHEKRYCCEKCAFQIEQYSKFKLHQLTHKSKADMDHLDLKYHCDKCDYKTYRPSNLRYHNLNHHKPDEIEYFYCYHCSHKCKQRGNLITHISIHFKNEEVPFHCYICDFMTLKRELITEHIKKHSEVQSKAEIEEGS